MLRRSYLNLHRSDASIGDDWTGSQETRSFHEKLPGYEPTPLVLADGLAEQLGLEALMVKDEASRLTLPSFKILGASWATYNTLKSHFGEHLGPWEGIERLRANLADLGPLTLVAATDGNHGRAVARMAKLLGLKARIFVPHDMAKARRDAIVGEGADLLVVHGTYDDAIERSAQEASDHALVVSDTSWPGYVETPQWIIEGYSTIMDEIDGALEDMGQAPPDLVLVQMGVGALAAAVTAHYRRHGLEHPPVIIGVEPEGAHCVLAAAEAGEIVTVPGPHTSIMAGLNCGNASQIAYPVLANGIDLFVTIDDESAKQGMRDLATEGIVSGETGAAAYGALRDLMTTPEGQRVLDPLGHRPRRVLVISTEGATDPQAYEEIVGRKAESSVA